MNKQLKIIENKIKTIENEQQQLGQKLLARQNYLLLNDALYQNLTGQKTEKVKRLNDMQDYLKSIPKEKD